MSDHAIYKFALDCGRMGDLEGVFIAAKEQVSQAIGKEAYFDDVLGNHSEIYVTLTKGHIKMVTDDPTVIEIIKGHGLTSGYNPLDYIEPFG